LGLSGVDEIGLEANPEKLRVGITQVHDNPIGDPGKVDGIAYCRRELFDL